MPLNTILAALKQEEAERNCYQARLTTLRNRGQETHRIENGVADCIRVLEQGTKSFVVYGEPQSGKTEFMIALVCKLLDLGRKTIFVIMNDNSELEQQNFDRFHKAKELNPTPLRDWQIVSAEPKDNKAIKQRVIFCRKNSRNLEKLIHASRFMEDRIVLDDEADFATPNTKINKNELTKINDLVKNLGNLNEHDDGVYIGVTATPARLDLNNTFLTDAKNWVFLESYETYKGRNFFFPATEKERRQSNYSLVKLPDDTDEPKLIRHAIFRFLLRAAIQNIPKGASPTAYSMLIHTAGKTNDHVKDEAEVSKVIRILGDQEDKKFSQYVEEMDAIAKDLIGQHRVAETADNLVVYVLANIGRSEVLIINHKNDGGNVKRAGEPQAMFTFAIGGNIVSRGLTFENLLSFYFSRTVKGRLQQNTYIQRARMFGNRPYSEYFELCVPESLFIDWATVFQDHELSLRLAKAGVYQHIQSGRTSVIDGSAIDKNNVTMDKSERPVGEVFQLSDEVEEALLSSVACRPLTLLENLKNQGKIPEFALPKSLLEYLREVTKIDESDVLIVVRDQRGEKFLESIESYADGDPETILRQRGGMIHAILNKRSAYREFHHFILPVKNSEGKARFFYKSNIGVTILQNLRTSRPTKI